MELKETVGMGVSVSLLVLPHSPRGTDLPEAQPVTSPSAYKRTLGKRGHLSLAPLSASYATELEVQFTANHRPDR